MCNICIYFFTRFFVLFIGSSAYASMQASQEPLSCCSFKPGFSVQAPSPSLPDLATVRREFAYISQASEAWPDIIVELIAATEKLHAASATAALASVQQHIASMRDITTAAIDEHESLAKIQYQYTRARLYLSLARSACSRAATALVANTEVPALLLLQLNELSAAMDQLLTNAGTIVEDE